MIGRGRLALLVVGALAAAYGVYRLLDLGWANTRSTFTWLLGGVVLHDGVFAPIVLGIGAVAVRLVPRRLLAPLVAGLVVLVPVTLLAIPELGRFGASPSRPTLLDRDYWLGWSVLATLVLVCVAAGTVAVVRAGRREAQVEGGPDGPGPGRR